MSQTIERIQAADARGVAPFKTQLLKWIGNKQRFAHEIIAHFPERIRVYREPFLGSAGVLGVLAPARAVGSDSFAPLIEIWRMLADSPETVTGWYEERWREMAAGDPAAGYEAIKARYNANPNAADLLFLCRACYGGVVRFRLRDGHMSTPVGAHRPIHPERFAERARLWRERVKGAVFRRLPYEEAMAEARRGDLIYCDPPYSHSQAILYGAQRFSLEALFEAIAACKARGVHVALSIDGSKRSGEMVCDIPAPKGLFTREIAVNIGRSMLKRFQMEGRSLEREVVSDRLLLTY